MKTIQTRSKRRPALLLLALLSAPFALPADDMTNPAPAVPLVEPKPAPVVNPSDVAVGQDLNLADAVNRRLNVTALQEAVERAEYTARERALVFAAQGAEEGRTITASLKAGALALTDDEHRKTVETAILKAEQARDRLTQAIAKAQESTAKRWSDIREELADRYEKYATLLEEARKAAIDNGVVFAPRVPATVDPVDRTRG